MSKYIVSIIFALLLACGVFPSHAEEMDLSEYEDFLESVNTVEVKPEVKSAPEVKAEVQVQAKTEAKAALKAKPEVKAEVKPTAKAEVKITPSHVYQRIENIIAEINLIRKSLGVDKKARVPGVQAGKKPLHVYGKSMEVLDKVARAQLNLGIAPPPAEKFPFRAVTPKDVYEFNGMVLEELRRIKRHRAMKAKIDPAPFKVGKTPSDVYEAVWQASYLIDTITGDLKPSNVYRNAQYVLEEVEMIADKMKVILGDSSELDDADAAGINPTDVNIEGFKNLYRVNLLQRKLNIDPVNVAAFPSGKNTPSDVFDTTNELLAELHRIKLHLNIDKVHSERSLPEGKKPADVLAKMKEIGNALERLESRS